MAPAGIIHHRSSLLLFILLTAPRLCFIQRLSVRLSVLATSLKPGLLMRSPLKFYRRYSLSIRTRKHWLNSVSHLICFCISI